MNWDQIQGKWKQVKGEATVQWGKLTDDDFDKVNGDRQKLEGILQERYGKTKEEISSEVDSWMKKVS
jgi:uncharacterized protein YjbJ (UPF0337 family)